MGVALGHVFSWAVVQTRRGLAASKKNLSNWIILKFHGKSSHMCHTCHFTGHPICHLTSHLAGHLTCQLPGQLTCNFTSRHTNRHACQLTGHRTCHES